MRDAVNCFAIHSIPFKARGIRILVPERPAGIMGFCRCRAASSASTPYSPVRTHESDDAKAEIQGTAQQTFIVSKLLMLRGMGAVYLFAFMAAYQQNRALIGSAGLSPAREHLSRIEEATPWDSFLAHPAVWWFWPLTDDRLDAVALAGVALSTLVCFGMCSSVVMLVLWLLYFSIVTAAEGSTFYSYGWESQILETGFLSMLLCELTPWRLGRTHPPSLPTLWLFRWLMFRISIGAGLITAKMDQVREVIAVSMCAERDFGQKQWERLHGSLTEWRDSIRSLLTVLQNTRPSS